MSSHGESTVDQQAELVRHAERTARAAETISNTLLVWSALACLAGVIYVFHLMAQ